MVGSTTTPRTMSEMKYPTPPFSPPFFVQWVGLWGQFCGCVCVCVTSAPVCTTLNLKFDWYRFHHSQDWCQRPFHWWSLIVNIITRPRSWLKAQQTCPWPDFLFFSFLYACFFFGSLRVVFAALIEKNIYIHSHLPMAKIYELFYSSMIIMTFFLKSRKLKLYQRVFVSKLRNKKKQFVCL